MSATNYAASFSNATIGSLYFNVARTNVGRINDRLQRIYEELQAPGVDGRRWRLKNNIFQDFQMETWTDAYDYENGVVIARLYDGAQGQYVNLTWRAATFTPQQYISVKIVSASPVVMAGNLGGYGVSVATNTAMVRCSWTLAVLAQEGVTP